MEFEDFRVILATKSQLLFIFELNDLVLLEKIMTI
jgi:hypothetical protein